LNIEENSAFQWPVLEKCEQNLQYFFENVKIVSVILTHFLKKFSDFQFG